LDDEVFPLGSLEAISEDAGGEKPYARSPSIVCACAWGSPRKPRPEGSRQEESEYMGSVKNEHIVYAYAPNTGKGGYVLIVGLTPTGCDYLKDNPGMTLNVTQKRFTEITDVVVFGAESKQAIKDLLAKAGTVVSEVN
jgi:hypothetical protein